MRYDLPGSGGGGVIALGEPGDRDNGGAGLTTRTIYGRRDGAQSGGMNGQGGRVDGAGRQS